MNIEYIQTTKYKHTHTEETEDEQRNKNEEERKKTEQVNDLSVRKKKQSKFY